jgi:hypothetical protein
MTKDVDWAERRKQLGGGFTKWETPGQVVEGVLVSIDQDTYPDGREYLVLTIETSEDLVKVSDGPVMLARALADAAPAIGDTLRVEYLGESEKSVPGRSPAKLFRIDLGARAQPVDVEDLA